jgi:hypothetical protein
MVDHSGAIEKNVGMAPNLFSIVPVWRRMADPRWDDNPE